MGDNTDIWGWEQKDLTSVAKVADRKVQLRNHMTFALFFLQTISLFPHVLQEIQLTWIYWRHIRRSGSKDFPKSQQQLVRFSSFLPLSLKTQAKI